MIKSFWSTLRPVLYYLEFLLIFSLSILLYSYEGMINRFTIRSIIAGRQLYELHRSADIIIMLEYL